MSREYLGTSVSFKFSHTPTPLSPTAEAALLASGCQIPCFLPFEDECVIYIQGCGFVRQITIVAFNGENVWNFTITAGHTVSCMVSKAVADAPIEWLVQNSVSLDQIQHLVQTFLSWLPIGIREAREFRGIMSSYML